MNSKQAANILALYSYYHPNETIDEIAVQFKLPVALIVNALYYGERHNLFMARKKGAQYKEIVVATPPADDADYGKDLERVKNTIVEVITNLNSDKEDITDDNLFIWLGVPFIVAKTALQLLVNNGWLAKYSIRDAKDPKSKYIFYTLAENKDKRYGRVQFKREQFKDKKKDEQLQRRSK